MKVQSKSKFLVLILLLAIALPQWGFTQKKGGDKMAKMQTELNLSDQQVADIKAIHEGFRDQMKAMRASENKDKESMKNMRQKKEAAILEVLNEEQALQYKARKEKGKIRNEERKEKRKALKMELKAYKDQEIKPVMARKRSEFDSQLSPEDKAEIADLRQAFKSLKKEAKGKGIKGGKGNASRGLQKGDSMAGSKKMGRKRSKGFHRAMEENPELEQRSLALVNKYARDLDRIESDLAPFQQKWKTDKESILAKHLEATTLEKMAQKKADRDEDQKSSYKRIHFLLMDPGV